MDPLRDKDRGFVFVERSRGEQRGGEHYEGVPLSVSVVVAAPHSVIQLLERGNCCYQCHGWGGEGCLEDGGARIQL